MNGEINLELSDIIFADMCLVFEKRVAAGAGVWGEWCCTACIEGLQTSVESPRIDVAVAMQLLRSYVLV